MKGTSSLFSLFAAKNDKDFTFIFIVLIVLFLHFLAVCLSFYHFAPSPPKRSQKIVVKTVALQPLSIHLATQDNALKPAYKVDSVPLPREEKSTGIKQPVKSAQAGKTPKIEEKTGVKKQAPQQANILQNKTVAKKEVDKPKTNPSVSKISAKAKPAAKQVVKKPVPVKKQEEVVNKPKKTEIKKSDNAEDLAAQEAAKKRQKELEEARQKQRLLLAQAKEKLVKIEETRSKIETNKLAQLEERSIPSSIEHLKIDALPVGNNAGKLTAKEMSYGEEVAYLLKHVLCLPDYGQLKLKLTLNRQGKVIQVQIVNSESNKNREYIERQLPKIPFPVFGEQFAGMAQYNFLITLNNDYTIYQK